MCQELKSQTIPEIFFKKVKSKPNDIAYRVKKFGIYRERNWLNFYQMVESCAMGFIELGLKHGDFIALFGDPSEECTVCELAANSLGAISVCLHPNFSSKYIEDILQDFKPVIIIIGNQLYLDRISSLFGKFTFIRTIIIIDTKGLFELESLSLISFNDLIQKGKDRLKFEPEAFKKIIEEVKPTDGLFVTFTSGVSGKPKGVLISHGKYLLATNTLIELHPILTTMTHRTLAYLPISHFISKMVTITLPLLASIIPHYGDPAESLHQCFFETAPTFLFTTPAYLKKLASIIFIGIENSSWFKRVICKKCLEFGRSYIKNLEVQTSDIFSRIIYFICYQTIFRPILNKIGFDKLKIIISTGSNFPYEIFKLWRIYGLKISDMYAVTEIGIITKQESNFLKTGNINKASYLELRISKEGEILIRGDRIFNDYCKESNLSVIDSEGWFHTGDFGMFGSNGNLMILGRLEDIIKTSGEEIINLKHIENHLKSNHYINEAIVFRTQNNNLIALIEINYETLSNWARKGNIQFTDYSSLVQNSEIVKFIGKEIDNINNKLEPKERINAYKLLPVELIPGEEGSPLTYNRKISRQKVFEKFGNLIKI